MPGGRRSFLERSGPSRPEIRAAPRGIRRDIKMAVAVGGPPRHRQPRKAHSEHGCDWSRRHLGQRCYFPGNASAVFQQKAQMLDRAFGVCAEAQGILAERQQQFAQGAADGVKHGAPRRGNVPGGFANR